MTLNEQFIKYIESSVRNIYTEKNEIWKLLLSKRSPNNSLIYKQDFLSNYSAEATGVGGGADVQSRLKPLINYLSIQIDKNFLRMVPGSNVGNPDLIKLHSIKTNLSHLWNLCHVQSYFKYLDLLKKKNGRRLDVIEIGPGYGDAAHILISLGVINSYTCVDLAENIGNSVYFLNKNHPEWKITFINSEIDLDTSSTSLNFLTADRFKKLHAKKFDVILNSDSFGEMPAHTALGYISRINFLLKECGLIISINGHRRGQYNLTGINRVSDYGYHNFNCILFTYKKYFSSSMDDFGHIAICENVKPNAVFPKNYLDVLGDLFALGLNIDLDYLIANINSPSGYVRFDEHIKKIDLYNLILEEKIIDSSDLIGKYINFVRKVIKNDPFVPDEYDVLIKNIKSPQAIYILMLCRLIATADWNFWVSEKLDSTINFLMSDLERFRKASIFKRFLFLRIRKNQLKKKFYPRRNYKLTFLLRIMQIIKV